MLSNTRTLVITINRREDEDDEKLSEALQRLRAEILEADVASADYLKSGPPPEGSRAADAVTVGTIIVALSASGGVITTLVGVLQTYLSRNDKRSITLKNEGGREITINGHKPEDEQRILHEWISKE